VFPQRHHTIAEAAALCSNFATDAVTWKEQSHDAKQEISKTYITRQHVMFLLPIELLQQLVD